MVMDEGGVMMELGERTQVVRGRGVGGGAGGVSDRVVLSAPLWLALQGSPGACSVK